MWQGSYPANQFVCNSAFMLVRAMSLVKPAICAGIWRASPLLCIALPSIPEPVGDNTR